MAALTREAGPLQAIAVTIRVSRAHIDAVDAARTLIRIRVGGRSTCGRSLERVGACTARAVRLSRELFLLANWTQDGQDLHSTRTPARTRIVHGSQPKLIARELPRKVSARTEHVPTSIRSPAGPITLYTESAVNRNSHRPAIMGKSPMGVTSTPSRPPGKVTGRVGFEDWAPAERARMNAVNNWKTRCLVRICPCSR